MKVLLIFYTSYANKNAKCVKKNLGEHQEPLVQKKKKIIHIRCLSKQNI